MKLTIHHRIGDKVAVSVIPNADVGSAEELGKGLAGVRREDGFLTSPGVVIPARNIELIEVTDD